MAVLVVGDKSAGEFINQVATVVQAFRIVFCFQSLFFCL
jgi:hypothetical protein